MLKLPPLKVKKLHPEAKLPVYASEGAACFDLFAFEVDGIRNQVFGKHVYSQEPVTCSTGLAFEIPPGWVMTIYSRSGHGFKNATRLANCVGVIDSDYRGCVQVKLTCDQADDDGTDPLFIKPGDRIAQARLEPAPQVEFVEVDELSHTARGDGGFGSTGA